MAATQLTSKARRPKNSWQMVTVKVLDTYQMNISYRNTRGESAPHSSSAKNVTAKVPYGPPISCEYRTRKDVQSGDHIKEFKFLNRRREGACFDETMLNNICTEVTPFGQRVTSLSVTPDKKKVLANYVTLLQFSKGFIHHNQELYDDDGFAMNGKGIDLTELETNGGSLIGLRSFVQAAKESAKIVDTIQKAHESMVTSAVSKRKRKAPNDAEPKQVAKKSKPETLDFNEKQELEDPNGLEKKLQKSYMGVAWIPLDSISISKDLIKVNTFRTYSVMNSIQSKYDPSLATIVVCPENDEEEIDTDNIGVSKFVVIQKVHTLDAFKQMDKTGEFKKLPGHHNRMVLCYIIDTNSAALAHFANIRSNEISHQNARQLAPQNLLHVFESLQKKDRNANNLKVIERIAKHSRVGYNETSSVMKLCKWSDEGFKSLMEVLELFEIYESKDVKPSARFTALLARGEKLKMTNELLNNLARCEENYFKENFLLVTSFQKSLKNLVDTNIENINIRKAMSALSQISGFESMDALDRKYPGRFAPEVMKDYIGAEVKNGVKSQKYLELEKFFNDVKIKNSTSMKIDSPVQFTEIESLAEVASIGDNFDMVIFNMKEPSQDICMSIIRSVLSSDAEFHAGLLVFPNESLQFESLSFIRSQPFHLVKDLKIVPVLFHNDKAKSVGDIVENVSFAILFGKMKLLSPPFKILYTDIKQLLDIIVDVAPPTAKIAIVTDLGLPVVQIHSDKLLHYVNYVGFKDNLAKFKMILQKDKQMFDHRVQPKTTTTTSVKPTQPEHPVQRLLFDKLRLNHTNETPTKQTVDVGNQEFSSDESSTSASPFKSPISDPKSPLNDSGFVTESETSKVKKKVDFDYNSTMKEIESRI